jgi:hypothetical protein
MHVVIDADNNDFMYDPCCEGAQMLRDAADWLEAQARPGANTRLLRDASGNTVGQIDAHY